MNKPTHIFAVLSLCILLCFTTTSCLDDDNKTTIDEVWKSRNEQLFKDKKITGEYTDIISPLYMNSSLYILAKPSSEITSNESRATNYDVVEFTDSVACRYTGWFIDNNGKKYIFDSTEVPTTGGYNNPNSVPIGFKVGSVIEGWRAALYNMKEGDELEIVIPQTLGYGGSANGSIPAYTTLFFNIKLTKLFKMKGRK